MTELGKTQERKVLLIFHRTKRLMQSETPETRETVNVLKKLKMQN